MQPAAYLNGRFLPAGEASISLGDAGFVLGAAVTEQLRTFGGTIFRLEAHLRRLERSLAILGVEPAVSLEEMADVADTLVKQNYPLLAKGDDLGVAMLVTPGPYAGFSQAADAGPTVCISTYPLAFRLWANQYQQGQALVTTSIQQVPQQCWPTELKCRSRMHYYLAEQEARRKSPGSRALLQDASGQLTETSTANFVVIDSHGRLISPPREAILHGVSLAVLEELAVKAGLKFIEQRIEPQDLAEAREALLTSTPNCLLPVTRFNDRPIGDGQPGRVFRQMLAAWDELVGLDIEQQARQFSLR
jgi:branched-subunit amino acid aminotransferase/4-amino-4-deoxychorismate lyase